MPTVTTTYVIGNGNNGAGANQIASETTSGVTTAYAYDGNGNRTGRTISGTTDVFSYDYENRLTSFNYLTGSSGTGMYTYAYDYRTRRVSRTEPSAGTTYIVFDGGTSIIEYGAAGAANPSAEYIRGFNYGGGVGGLEYSVRGGVPSFNFYDSRGDVVAKTNSSGAITWETAYEAFGNQTASTPGAPPLDRQRASTKEQDPTGFLNEGFRYRDLSTGTFLTRDPLGFKAGLNNYTYGRQNPWTSFDPEGLDATQPNPPPPPPPKHPSAKESSKHPNTPPKKKTTQPDQKKSASRAKPDKSGADKSGDASKSGAADKSGGASKMPSNKLTPAAPPIGSPSVTSTGNDTPPGGRTAESGFAVGISGEVSTINPLTSGGGGAYGVNFEYTSSDGFHMYWFYTPSSDNSLGFAPGFSATANAATGTGPWTGLFNNVSASAGPLTAGAFQSSPASPGYTGYQAGFSAGPPGGFGITQTNYIPGWF